MLLFVCFSKQTLILFTEGFCVSSGLKPLECWGHVHVLTRVSFPNVENLRGAGLPGWSGIELSNRLTSLKGAWLSSHFTERKRRPRLGKVLAVGETLTHHGVARSFHLFSGPMLPWAGPDSVSWDFSRIFPKNCLIPLAFPKGL